MAASRPDLRLLVVLEEKGRSAFVEVLERVHELLENEEPAATLSEQGFVALRVEKVGGIEDYQRILAKFKPGDRVTVRYLRDEEEATVELTLQGI